MTDEELFERIAEVAAECDARADALMAEAWRSDDPAASYRQGRVGQAFTAADSALFEVVNLGHHFGGIEAFQAMRWTEAKRDAREAAARG